MIAEEIPSSVSVIMEITMLITVVILNCTIALCCLVVAWRVWVWGRTLAKVADALTRYERNTHRKLYYAPAGIRQGQVGVRQLRQNLQQIEPQLQQLQRAIALMNLIFVILRRSPWRMRFINPRTTRKS